MLRSHLMDTHGSVGAGLETAMDRRRLLKMAAGFGAAAVAGSLVVAQPAAAAGGGYLQTTSALNLRSGASTNHRVLLVIPLGARVFDHGELRNGFRKVTYNNTPGWAFDAYLKAGTSVPPHAGPVIGTGVVAIALNLRSGPSTGERVIRVMAKGDQVEITATIVDGYRYVYHQGIGGWAFDQYLAPAGGEGPALFTTTTAVNLRTKPSTSARVLLVVPAGAVVADYDLVMSNGFRGVDYKGTVGWIYDQYLK